MVPVRAATAPTFASDSQRVHHSARVVLTGLPVVTLPRWRNWQTRGTVDPVPSTESGFDPRSGHGRVAIDCYAGPRHYSNTVEGAKVTVDTGQRYSHALSRF